MRCVPLYGPPSRFSSHSKVNFDKEVKTIKYIARRNRISTSLIDKMIKKKLFEKAINGTSTLGMNNSECVHS